MSSSVADLFIVLDSVTDPFSSGLKKAASDAESMSGRMSTALGAVAKVGLGVGVAVGGIAVASVKAASDFQTQMTRLYTAAGAPKQAVQQATGAVLQLGTQVGMTGTQMAEALYHPVSAGLDMATALQVVRYAAEEAQISGANLDDTTYSLSSVMKAFNFPASQAAQTMATLNAVVGDGDMRFQDFNASIKNWAPTAAQMGMSVSSMGAGLAYLTDRGNSAEEASTRLTMGISMMATPSKQAASLLEGLGVASSDVKGSTAAMTEVLQKTGITQNELAADLAKPDGLYIALSHLKTALDAAGVHGTEADSAIAKIFGGGRSDKAILSLMQNLDGLKQKYDQITTDSTTTKFQQNWGDVRKTFTFQIDQIKVGAENLGIELGTKLLPVLSDFITQAEGKLGPFFQQVGQGFGQLASGFTGRQLSAPDTAQLPHMGNAMLNAQAAAGPQPQNLSTLQQWGATVRRIIDDVGSAATKLKPTADNFVRFGEDAYQALVKIVQAATPTVKLLGEGLFGALSAVGTVLANVVGPAFKWFGDFLDSHKTLFEYFAVGVLGAIAAKMILIGGINAVTGIVNLATSIVQFPLSQANAIGTALTELKTAYTGADAAEGEQAVLGLRGAFDNLKTSVGGALDKVAMLNGANLSGLAAMANEMGVIQTEEEAGGQTSLFQTRMSGIVQVAEQAPEQLALFETSLTGIADAEETVSANALTAAGSIGTLTSQSTIASVGNLATAETAVATEGAAAAGGLAGIGSKIAGFLGPVGIAIGVVTALGIAISKLDKPTQVTAQQIQSFQDTINKAAQGSAAAAKQFQMEASQALAAAISPGGPNAGHEQDINAIDTALANLVKSGSADAAKKQVADLDKSVSKLGISSDTVASHLPQYENALKNVGTAAQTADGKVSGLLATMDKQQSINQFQSDLNGLSTAFQQNKGDLTSNTDAAIANRQAFSQAATDIVNFYQQQRNAGVPINQASQDLQNQVNSLEQTGIQAGYTKGDVDKYLKTLGLVPSSIGTTLGLDVTPAMNQLNQFIRTVDDSSAVVTIYGNTAGTSAGTSQMARGGGARAAGGAVDADQVYWVGENGPEWFVPGASGYITPTSMIKPAVLAGLTGAAGTAGYAPGGGTTVMNNYYFTTKVAGSVLAERDLETVVQRQVLQYKTRNSGNGLG